jgi:hypothetical protein
LTSISIDNNYNNLQINSIQLTNLDIDIPGSYFVLVNVSGLSGSINMSNNNSDFLTITMNGQNNFANAISNGSGYSVSITSQPNGQVCSISNLQYGTSSTNVTIQVLCVSGYLFNGTLLGALNPPTATQPFTGLLTLAGSFPPTATNAFVNGTGSAARFDNPIAITTDTVNLYIADIFNNAVRKMAIGTNAVSTLALITNPHGVTTDGTNVYVSSFSQNIIQKIVISSGTITTIAGTGSSGDFDAVGTLAQFNVPTYLTTDGNYVYITDRSNNKIKKYDLSSGMVTTIASGLNAPNGITTNGSLLYIADTNNNQIQMLNLSTLVMSVIAGTGISGYSDNATGTLAQFDSPYGLTMDGSYLYVLEGNGRKIRRVSLTSPYAVTTILNTNSGYLDGVIGTAQFCNASPNCNTSLTFDGTYVYFADRFNHSIRRLY